MTPPAQEGLFIGCAGWSLRREFWPRFPEAGSHLQRYAARFPAVEINSSFYRPHKPATYARWAESVPDNFRFSVKLPKAITHEHRLLHAEEALDRFLAEVSALGKKLGCLLIQLPPSMGLNPETADAFFHALRQRYSGAVVVEPRHASWFTPQASQLVLDYRVARVAADPAPVALAAEPGGWPGLVYYRLHGSPEMYYSSYAPAYLDRLADKLAQGRRDGVPTWCIFDNTTVGAATENALDLLRTLGGGTLASDAATSSHET